jgi:NAD-dependent SIR2 family protein deacetylase
MLFFLTMLAPAIETFHRQEQAREVNGMIWSVECSQCHADFELDLAELTQTPELMVCPNCDAKAEPSLVEAAVTALDESLALIRRLHRRFRIQFVLDEDEFADEQDEAFDDEDALWANEVGEEEEEE